MLGFFHCHRVSTRAQCIAVSTSAGRRDGGIKGCWCWRVCVTDKRQRSALLFYLSLRWCHPEDCVLWCGGGCRRLDLCLRYTTAELEKSRTLRQNNEGEHLNNSRFQEVNQNRRACQTLLNDANVDSESSFSRIFYIFFFFFKNEKEEWIALYEGGVLLLYF